MILGTICCRGGSKGVPGKNIKPLYGKPLIEYTLETATKSSLLEDTIVSTDSEEIARIAKAAGGNVPFMRPDELASDTANKWDVFRHVVETYESLYNKRVDFLVDMDVTVPLKSAQDIDGIIQYALDRPHADVVITAYEPERNPYFNMMEIGDDGYATIVKKPKKAIVRRQDAPKVLSLTPAAYVIRRDALYAVDHWSNANCLLYEIPRMRAIDIDTEFDFRLVEFIIKENG
jgi:CMP-N,N'-diacetyllegionaminic acid synthase